MRVIDKSFIEMTDSDLIQLDVPLYARPFQVVMTWMKVNHISGDILSDELWKPLMVEYKKLYPSGDFYMPSMFVGSVGLRDQGYLVRINLAYGKAVIEPLKCIEIPPEELNIIWNQNPSQVWRAMYSVADMWDFSYAVDDLSGQSQDANQLWSNARSSLSSTARILTGGHDLASSVQTSFLSAELAMKGMLAFCGWSEKKRRKLNHGLIGLAEAVISCRSASNDDRLLSACGAFPDYIRTRYEEHGLTTVQLIELGMRSQFVAAEVLRRVSDRNFAGEIEVDQATPSREEI